MQYGEITAVEKSVVAYNEWTFLPTSSASANPVVLTTHIQNNGLQYADFLVETNGTML